MRNSLPNELDDAPKRRRRVCSAAAPTEAAKALGYAEEDGCVVGPDKYRFRLLTLPSGRSERFLYVMCRSGNLEKTVGFYKDFLGMVDVEVPSGIPSKPKTAAVSYTSEMHPHGLEPVLLVWYEDGVAPKPTPWEGRHALGYPGNIHHAFVRYKKEFPDKIMHDEKTGGPISLQEKLGTLFIFIARDYDGYEMCYVSRETMLPAVVEAATNYDGKALDFDTRAKRIAAIEKAGREVEELLKSNPVVLFSKEWCPFCRKAKDALSSIDAKYLVKELENADKKPNVEDPMSFQEYLAAKTNAGKSVPKGFIKGEFIGGGDDIVELNKRGVAVGAAAKKEAPAGQDGHFFYNGKLVAEAEWKACEV
ncbi:Glutaredoxin-1 [Symbiodinium microadriaticum]|uniref:Glutaredoxin-1 n=1 Tax=Symbiodinium microadriaticum TaxID=2951 RepID=A0A1Q9ECF8_SYMMI|nr:Glutaredoxin-1 [Symbiodinium microadriaticum]